MTLRALLSEIENRVGGSFLISDSKGASWCGRLGHFYLSDNDPTSHKCWYSNLLYAKTANRKSRKAHTALPTRFIRIDLELPDHTQAPSQQERTKAAAWGIKTGACAALNTPHGVHLLYVLDKPLKDRKDAKAWVCQTMGVEWLGDHRYKNLEGGYDGEMLPCRASWTPAILSRYVDKPVFAHYNEVSSAITHKPKAFKSAFAKQLKGSKKDYTDGQVRRVQQLRASGADADTIQRLTNIKPARLQAILEDPNYQINYNDADNADCLTPHGPRGYQSGKEQQTYKYFADRWWCYQEMRYRGVKGEHLIIFVKEDDKFAKVREHVANAFGLAGQELDAWLEADVQAQEERFPDNYEKKQVSNQTLIKVSKVLKTLDIISLRKVARAVGISHLQAGRAAKQLGYSYDGAAWKSDKVVKPVKPAKQKPERVSRAINSEASTFFQASAHESGFTEPQLCVHRAGNVSPALCG